MSNECWYLCELDRHLKRQSEKIKTETVTKCITLKIIIMWSKNLSMKKEFLELHDSKEIYAQMPNLKKKPNWVPN